MPRQCLGACEFTIARRSSGNIHEIEKKTSRVSVVGRVGVAVGVGAVILAAAAYFTGLVGGHPKLEGEPASAKVESKAGPSDTVDLTEKQVASIKVEPVGERLFAVEKGAVGNIDYNQDMAVQVFTNYQGRINGLFAKVGDDVKKDQTSLPSTVPTCCRRSPH